ncbi:sn-glycerol-3-phosphate transporter [Pseudomonas sp. dw_358]|uniref:sn-glycerol-3-phosphate transporter n=1 Tax=Pseudomonas sp. dw_358 TaxID=2720083 RepID=UPI001BD431A6|nr:sn-glycerol-3-phosphate transporter [Pseudomonas sp. dw_358]
MHPHRPLCTLVGVLALSLAVLSTAQADTGHWYLQTSAATQHFSNNARYNNRQDLIGLERNRSDRIIFGAATFRNSFSQRSHYAYAGKRFDADTLPIYAKVSGGLVHGYRGDYRDKLPLNRFGVAPVIIPAVGANLGPIGIEWVLLGMAATMVNVGVKF